MNTITNTSPLLPGHPQDNPVLAGLSSILEGGDPEEAMFQRDQALSNPKAFCKSAWDALSWMAWPNEISMDLVDQMAAVAARLPVSEQRDQWGTPLTASIEGAWQVARERALAAQQPNENPA